MDVKARSKAMREILTRLVERARGSIEVKVFGDKVILDEGTPLTMLYRHLLTLLVILKTLKTGHDATYLFHSFPPTSRLTKRFNT